MNSTIDLTTTVASGSLFLAFPIALFAGLISFLSPCVLPLVPGYLSYITGVAGAHAVLEKQQVTRSRVIAGTMLFIAGFSSVFVAYGALFGGLGEKLIRYQQQLQYALGALVIVMGLSFLGLLPGLQRDVRIHRMPSGTMWGAPLLGVLFGLGWTPCIGPTLAVVQSLAITEASAVRGAVLSAAYCLGLGIPFVVIGLLLDRGVTALKVLRTHSQLIMKIGGILMIAIGVLMVTGVWNDLMIDLRVWASNWQVQV